MLLGSEQRVGGNPQREENGTFMMKELVGLAQHVTFGGAFQRESGQGRAAVSCNALV